MPKLEQSLLELFMSWQGHTKPSCLACNTSPGMQEPNLGMIRLFVLPPEHI